MVSRLAHMPRGLLTFLRITDLGMLGYWAVSFAAVVGLVRLPAAAMYAGYGTPVVDAWNWSFAPLDIAFAVCGLWSIRLARHGRASWKGLAIVSLTLTICAGGMAIAFWTLLKSFDPSWWVPNLILLLAPLVWLPRLVSDSNL